MDKNVEEAIIGAATGGVLQSLLMKYGDPVLAPYYLYSYTSYAADLRKAGYVPAVSTQTDADIGTLINSTAGYEWASGSPTNLAGTNKRTANRDTFAAAVGQKSNTYLLPSTLGSVLIGGLAIADSDKHWLFKKKNDVMEASLGGALLSSGATRMFLGGVKVYPSGFDVIATSTMQYMDNHAMQNLNRLSAENGRLQQELSQLRSAQHQAQQQIQSANYPRGMPPGVPSYTVNATQPVVQVTEIVPSKGSEAIKARTHMVSGAHMQKATPESVKHQTGLVTLTGGR